MRVSNVCSCRKGSFYSLFRRLNCSHCGSLRNLHHLPCSVFASSLHRHKISCPSIALECQSYECAQSRHWNCGFSGMITFFRAAISFAFNSDKFTMPDILERGFINVVRPNGTRIGKPHNPLVGNVSCLQCLGRHITINDIVRRHIFLAHYITAGGALLTTCKQHTHQYCNNKLTHRPPIVVHQ